MITKGASPTWQGVSYTDDTSQTLFVTSENVREGWIDLSERKYLEDGFNEKQKRSMLKKGDFLINIVGASIGRAARYDLDDKANINQAVALVRVSPEVINPDYLLVYLNSEKAIEMYNGMKSSVARANLSLQNISDLEILLPSQEGQNQYAQLIRQSDKSKFACLKSQFIEMFGDPVDNPKGFEKYPLMKLAKKITDGVHKKPVYTKTGIPFISVTNINRGVIDFTDCKFVSEEAYQVMIKTTYPERGDVLYTKVGATYGISAYVDTDKQFGLYVSVCLIKPKHDLIDAQFLTESMRMEYVKKQADERIKGIGVPDLHLREIKSFEILCPPRELQEQFVEFVKQSDKSK